MNKQKLQAMAEELAKDVKTPEDLSQLSAFLTKLTVEAALKGEMDHHLGYDKNDPDGHHSGNSHNGYSSQKLKGDHGEIDGLLGILCQSFKLQHNAAWRIDYDRTIRF